MLNNFRTLKSPKNPQKFYCESCDYSTSNKKDYNKHLTTRKHKNRTLLNDLSPKIPKNPQMEKKYICEWCNKEYSVRNSYWYHKKNCKQKNDNFQNENFENFENFNEEISNFSENSENFDENSENFDENSENSENFNENSEKFNEISKNSKQKLKNSKNSKQKLKNSKNSKKNSKKSEKNQKNSTDTILENFIEQNKELRKMIETQSKQISEMIPRIGNNTTNEVNINLFLKEDCKDALNFTDFINSLKLQLEDLENTGKLGYVDGISKILIDGLQQLELHKRPIHCTDVNNEVLYVKDNNLWELDRHGKPMVKKAIENLSKNNMKLIHNWVETNPECKTNNTPLNTDYMNIISNNLVSPEEKDKEMDKIIKNVAKEIVIE
jgi:hypothetical protein